MSETEGFTMPEIKYDLRDYLLVVSYLVNNNGYKSRGNCEEWATPTSQHALSLMEYHCSTNPVDYVWKVNWPVADQLSIGPKFRRQAKTVHKAIDLCKNITPTNQFTRELKRIANLDSFKQQASGIAAYIYQYWKVATRKHIDFNCEWPFTPGDKIGTRQLSSKDRLNGCFHYSNPMHCTCYLIREVKTGWGLSVLVLLIDDDDCVYKIYDDSISEGDHIVITAATVKANVEYRGVKQTLLSRVVFHKTKTDI